MAALETLVDNFDDNTVNGTLWPGNFGVYSETGGRARVQCDPNYGAFVSAAAYTLAGSHAFVQIYPPALGGALTSAYAQMSLLSDVEGTELGVKIDRVTGMLRCQSNTDYWDDNAVEVAYDPTAHAYVRIGEAGGTLTWSTSPDGTTWTTRRTLATPAWATAAVNIQLRLETRRDSGTVDFAEFDNLNTLPAPPATGGNKAAFLAFF